MLISAVRPDILEPAGPVSVALVDGGFGRLPVYASMHTANPDPWHRHGNTVLSVFTAPDGRWPIPGLELHLACFWAGSGVDGVAKAVAALPEVDILSISAAWAEDDRRLEDLLLSRAGTVVCALPHGLSLKYPWSYPGMTAVSAVRDSRAEFCLSPAEGWTSSSYAAPAVARLLAYGHGIVPRTDGAGILVAEIFRGSALAGTGDAAALVAGGRELSCPHCGRKMRGPTGAFLREMPDRCPRCGRAI